jgi:ABC-type transport system substrate-binding protein
MLNFRYILRFIGAFVSRFRVLIIAGVGFGILIFFLSRYLLPSLNFNETTKIGETGRYTVGTLPTSILNLIGDGLTKIDEEGNVIPDLASSWETTDKGKTWIFTLKDNLYWQDGDKITSKTINYQFSDVTIDRPDDKTLVFKLQNAYSAFPSVVSRPTFKSGLLGTGKWRVNKISLNGSIIEELDLSSKGSGRIIYKFYPTEERTKTAFELGEVDKIEDLFDVTPFDSWPKVKITSVTDTREFVAVFFNTQQGSVLSDKNLRQALSYAIDKGSLGGVRTISPI